VRAAARAEIVAGPGGRGAPVARVLRSESPLLLRWTAPTLHLLGGAAGPLAGDDLAVAVDVGAGASLAVRSAAASVVLPGRPGATPSRAAIAVTVGDGAALDWHPEPLVSTARSDHDAHALVRVAADARLRWRDDVVLGRWDEAPGRLRTLVRVERDGRPLLHHELRVGSDAPGWDGPAALGEARVLTTLVVVDPVWLDGGRPEARTRVTPTARGAVLPLEGPAVLVSVLAGTATEAAALLAELSADLGAGPLEHRAAERLDDPSPEVRADQPVR
jgi:urease accessory protein